MKQKGIKAVEESEMVQAIKAATDMSVSYSPKFKDGVLLNVTISADLNGFKVQGSKSFLVESGMWGPDSLHLYMGALSITTFKALIRDGMRLKLEVIYHSVYENAEPWGCVGQSVDYLLVLVDEQEREMGIFLESRFTPKEVKAEAAAA